MNNEMRSSDAQLRATLTADWHLSDTPPIARGENRQQWREVQADALEQLDQLNIVTFVAGDLLHTWKEQVWFVNFLLSLHDRPTIYAVPGNHDTPNHSIAELNRSAFQTLRLGRFFIWLDSWKRFDANHQHEGIVIARGFGFGDEVRMAVSEPLGKTDDTKLVVIHKYIWHGRERDFPGVAIEDHVKSIETQNMLARYDVALFGDNHQPFEDVSGTCKVFNAGCLIRRRSDERDIKPRVGLLYSDKSIVSHELDCSGDRWRENLDEMTADLTSAGLDPAAFLEALGSLGSVQIKFEDAVERYLVEQKVAPRIARKVRQIVEVADGR